MILRMMEFMLTGAIFILGACALILVLSVAIIIWDLSKHDSHDCE